ncbi:ThiF family adenylyltransferase [Candidatus Micrarchaeota archaeon]|nr:ThiF family adenylyltransferase [Candidatus Micrarchaeota archaeon]
MKITIIGAGGTGSFVCQELAKLKQVSEITLIDRDVVSEENLSRSDLFEKKDVDKFKALVVSSKIKKVIPRVFNLDSGNIHQLIKTKLFIDCTDNYETRMLLDEYARKENKTWIYTAAIKSFGMVSTITPTHCFACFAKKPKHTYSCNELGIEKKVLKLVAKKTAKEFLLLIKEKPALVEELWFVDSATSEEKLIPLPNCKCNNKFNYLKKKTRKIVLCGTNEFLFITNKKNTATQLTTKLKEFAPANKELFVELLFKEGKARVFPDGRIITTQLSEEKAVQLSKTIEKKL